MPSIKPDHSHRKESFCLVGKRQTRCEHDQWTTSSSATVRRESKQQDEGGVGDKHKRRMPSHLNNFQASRDSTVQVICEWARCVLAGRCCRCENEWIRLSNQWKYSQKCTGTDFASTNALFLVFFFVSFIHFVSFVFPLAEFQAANATSEFTRLRNVNKCFSSRFCYLSLNGVFFLIFFLFLFFKFELRSLYNMQLPSHHIDSN